MVAIRKRLSYTFIEIFTRSRVFTCQLYSKSDILIFNQLQGLFQNFPNISSDFRVLHSFNLCSYSCGWCSTSLIACIRESLPVTCAVVPLRDFIRTRNTDDSFGHGRRRHGMHSTGCSRIRTTETDNGIGRRTWRHECWYKSVANLVVRYSRIGKTAHAVTRRVLLALGVTNRTNTSLSNP